jgi:hypothetical protein
MIISIDPATGYRRRSRDHRLWPASDTQRPLTNSSGATSRRPAGRAARRLTP